MLDERQTRVLLTLLTRALEARTVVAGRITGGAGGNDVMVMRLVPSPDGCVVRTEHGVLHLPGLRLEVAPARGRTVTGDQARAANGAGNGASKAAPAPAFTGGHDG